MYKLEFTLKQHTPLIHFQHDQAGATLRATEVKPKLDRFLIEKLELTKLITKDNKTVTVPKEDYETWFNNKDRLSLDYKIHFNPTSDSSDWYLPLPVKPNNRRLTYLREYLSNIFNKEVDILAPTPFFANADKISYARDNVHDQKTKTEELRLAIYSKEDIDGMLISFVPDFLDKIKNHLVEFFLLHNFGTRQDKGFGSYTLSGLDHVIIKTDLELLKKVFSFNSRIPRNDLNEIFSFINDEYALLKSGRNYPKYEKSKLFDYFIQKRIRWEKRRVKQFINSNKIMNKELFWNKKASPIDIDDSTKILYNEWIDKQNNSYQYIRALLGLAEQFEYTVFSENQDDKGNWIRSVNRDGDYYSDNSKKYIVNLIHLPKPGDDKIERLKSPIFFKVIDGIIYVRTENSFQPILGQKFDFNLKLKGDSNGINRNIGSISVPTSFDIEDFLKKHLSTNWKNLNP